MKRDTFRNRYIIKLVGSIVIALMNVIIQLLLPRALSVEEYGYYSYNLNIFTSIVGLANLSASSAMVSKFAKRVDEIGIVLFYLKFFFIVAIILNIGVAVTYNVPFSQSLYVGQTLIISLLGLEIALVNKLIIDGVSIGDAMEISRFPVLIQLVMKVLLAGVAIIGFFCGNFNLLFFYSSQALITGIAVYILIKGLIKDQRNRYPHKSGTSKEYIREYFVFCKPLLISSIVSQITTIFVNWSLMNWSGSSEQAMFGVAWQINSLVGYVFTTYSELLKREFAVSYKKKEILILKYELSLRRMIWITAYFSMFIGFSANCFLPIVFGNKYNGAVIVTLLIMFYTVYQSWGQVSGSFRLALENTKTTATIAIIGNFLTLVCVYLFQIPNVLWPKSFGSIGVGLTYFVTNWIGTEISLYFDSRFLGNSFLKNSMIQIIPVFTCSITAFLLNIILDKMVMIEGMLGYLLKFITSGLIYTLVIFVVVWRRPQLAGVSRESIKTVLPFGKK